MAIAKRVPKRVYIIKANKKAGGGTEEWRVKGTSMEHLNDGEHYSLGIYDKKALVFTIEWSRVLQAYADGTAQLSETQSKHTNLVAGVRSLKQIKE